MTLEEVERECFILTIGAQDTMASLMSTFVNHVLEHPAVHSKLIAEIALFERRGQLSSPIVRYDETDKMPYFMACVHETLRLSPSVSMILPRYAPKNGVFIGKTWVSGKTEIAANPYVLHRNTDIFGSDAEKFRPERWLGDPESVRLMHRYFFAFGYGSRRCLGKSIALFILQKFLVQVRHRPCLRMKCHVAYMSMASSSGAFLYTVARQKNRFEKKIGASMFTLNSTFSCRHVCKIKRSA